MRVSYKTYAKDYPDISLKGARGGRYPCFYCGVNSSSIDHFIPQSFQKTLTQFGDIQSAPQQVVDDILRKQKFLPACRECNSMASDGVFETPDQKKSFVKAKIARRFERILLLPDWSEEDISGLNYELQKSVRGGLADREMVRQRLKW